VHGLLAVAQAWQVPKSVRVPSPMREESEGVPFSTPSPMHPRMAERAGGVGAARISTATSQGVTDGDLTPMAGAGAGELPLSPLGQHMAESRRERDFAPLPSAAAAAPAGGRQLPRSPNKPRLSVRSSAPVLRGYASVALSAAPLERPAERAAAGNSAASSVHPRANLLAESQQQQQPGRISRENRLGGDATLRASGSSSLRGSRELQQLEAAPPAAERPGLLMIDNEAYQPREAPLETPAPTKRAGLGSSKEFQGGPAGHGAVAGQEAATPSTGDSRGTYKVGYF
jgi:hypothetical protein